MKQGISIIFLIISGFFIMTVLVIAFFNMPNMNIGFIPKLLTITIFIIPALITGTIGLAISKFKNWKFRIGIVLLSSIGFFILEILTIVLLLADSKELAYYLEKNGQSILILKELKNIYNDYLFGGIVFACILITGLILTFNKSSKNELKKTLEANKNLEEYKNFQVTTFDQ
jgi:hypothetical protein